MTRDELNKKFKLMISVSDKLTPELRKLYDRYFREEEEDVKKKYLSLSRRLNIRNHTKGAIAEE